MKKKLSIILLTLFLLPLCALLGCKDVSSYPVYVYSSSTIHGSVSGTGTFADGSTVTLTAHAKTGSQFLGWVKSNNNLIAANEVYNINNTVSAENKITKSVLTFACNTNTQGQYTALFEDGKMMYIQFYGMYLSKNPNATPIEESFVQDALLNTNITVSQGTQQLVDIYQQNGLQFYDSVLVRPDNISNIIKFPNSGVVHIRANTQVLQNDQSALLNLRADLNFQESTPKNNDGSFQEIAGNNYKYYVDYQNGSYNIKFTFTVFGQTYYLTVVYKNL